MNIVQDWNELPTWQAMSVTIDEEEENLVRPPGLKFGCDPKLNERVKIWYVKVPSS
jgi:hypothetical protein